MSKTHSLLFFRYQPIFHMLAFFKIDNDCLRKRMNEQDAEDVLIQLWEKAGYDLICSACDCAVVGNDCVCD